MLQVVFWIGIVGSILYWLYRIKEKNLRKAGFALLFIKIVSALIVAWYYAEYQQGAGDVIRYFTDAKMILKGSISEVFNFLWNSDFGAIRFDTPRTALFLKFIIPIVWISDGNFWLSSIMISVLSFTVSFFVFKKYIDVLGEYGLQLIFVFFVLPSSLIWTSGLFKESISLILLMLFFLPFLELRRQKSTFNVSIYLWAIAIITFYYFIQLRYFIAILIIPVLGIAILGQQKRSLKFNISFISFIVASFFLFLFIHPVLNPQQLPKYLFDAHFGVLNLKSTSIPMYYDVQYGDWFDIFKNLPHALENAFLRPYPWEWTKIEYVVYAVENYLLILVILISLFRFKEFNTWHLLMLMVLIIGLAIISIATPNIGSLFRYRSLIFPFIALLILVHVPLYQMYPKFRLDR